MMFSKKEDDTPICPLMKSACIKAKCMWWTHIMGKHPQSGQDIDMFDCSMRWIPVLLIETSKEMRQAAAATESLRNQNVGVAQQLVAALNQVAGTKPQQSLGVENENLDHPR
jgi:hypothetical protein